MRQSFIPHFNEPETDINGRFITGNSFSMSQDGKKQALGKAYCVHVTSGGNRILLLGFLYDFPFFADNANVEFISDSVEESWFAAAMAEEDIDLIVVTAHVDPQTFELDKIYNAIRQHYPLLPLLLLSGHR